MKNITKQEIVNRLIEVGKKYFVSGGCSFADFYFQLLFGNTSRLKKEYFTIKDEIEKIPRRNACYYPYELFRVADGVEKK